MKITDMTTKELESFDWDSISDIDLKNIISQLDDESNIFNTLQMAKKICLNSIYGAMASNYFYFFNKDLAEAITLQGQNAIRYSEMLINDYFMNKFHLDTELLEYLATIQPDINKTPNKINSFTTIYCDTDSAYITFEHVMANIGWKLPSYELVLHINKFRLEKYFIDKFNEYCTIYNSNNYFDFELETIAEIGIWIKAKKYIQSIVWKDKNIYKSPKLKSTGVEIIRSNTPTFCRNELSNIVNLIFKKRKLITTKDINEYLVEVKKRFLIADVENICFTTSINKYHEYVLNDTNSLEFAPRTGAHLRGAAIFNNFVKNDEVLKMKYDLITNGDKVKWYYTTNQFRNSFAFKRGIYPREFAPEIDLNTMFEKSLISPLNNIIVALKNIGVAEINPNLKLKNKLF